MTANYLHGVETVEIERGLRPVRQVKSAVIALIGTAINGPINTPVLCLSDRDIPQFGPETDSTTITRALRVIFDYGAATVVVINVLDPAKHKKETADANITLHGDVATLPEKNLVSVTVKAKASPNTPYVEGTDYTVDLAEGTITRISSGAIAASAEIKVTYASLDPTAVTASDIVGAVTTAGSRTGIQALSDTYNIFGFFAKILIAPGYSSMLAVGAELAAAADRLCAMAYIDAPLGTTFSQVIAGRGPAGTIGFNTSSERVRLCYPFLKALSPETNKTVLHPLSLHAAALRARVDFDSGYWVSSSNNELKGITGAEINLTARIDDPQSEVNQLNENGITTVFNSFGTGLRLWGNRSASWPTESGMKTFENVRRTGDVLDESIRYFSLQYMDKPVDDAVIDAITESVNGFGRKLIGDGALLGFSCWYDPNRNTEDQLADGHVLLSYKYTPPPPLERLTFETEITSEYLLYLQGGNS